eukprot:s3358_g3.t5
MQQLHSASQKVLARGAFARPVQASRGRDAVGNQGRDCGKMFDAVTFATILRVHLVFNGTARRIAKKRSALDGLLLVHLAMQGQRLGIVGSRSLFDFVTSLPGYGNATRFFDSSSSYESYLQSKDYGFTDATPGLFGALEVKSAAVCPKDLETPQADYDWQVGAEGGGSVFRQLEARLPPQVEAGGCTGDWDVVIHLNMSGPSTSIADIKGDPDLRCCYRSCHISWFFLKAVQLQAADINVKLIPEVNKLQRGLSWTSSRVLWSGGLSRKLGLPLPTGGLVDLQGLVYAWVFNSTGAYRLPPPEELPSCRCLDPHGEATDDIAQCNSSQLLLVALRSLTPQWSTSALGESAGCLGRLSGLLPVSVREIPFPTIAYLDDPFATFVSAVFGLFFVLVFIWPLTRIIKSLVEDKEARINEVMKMMGMPAEAITFGWYLTYGWVVIRGFYPELFCQLKGLGTDASADGHDFLWVCHAALWCDLQNIGLHGHGSSEQGSW